MDEQDDVCAEIDRAAKARDDALNAEREKYAKLIIGANSILHDRLCPKCGYECSTRKYISANDYSGAVEHISYVCLCGWHWQGKTMEQYVEGARP